MRTNGAEALAFDVACLSGPEAALPHGSPGQRPVLDNAVLLFDFGAQVGGYRSDMTRTLFVGEPAGRDLAIYELSGSLEGVTPGSRVIRQLRLSRIAGTTLGPLQSFDDLRRLEIRCGK